MATFECREPQEVRYRLEAAPKSTSMWSDDGGYLEIELGEKYAWEYVANRKDFYIYRSMDPSTRELNTDPEVQALALNAVKKRRKYVIFASAYFLFLRPIWSTRGCLLMSAIRWGTIWMAMALLWFAWIILDEASSMLWEWSFQVKGGWPLIHGDRFSPTVIMRKGNTVVKASFLQQSEDGTLSVEEWAAIILDSREA